MKNFLTLLLGIICIAVLFFGHSYWNKQISASATNKASTAIKKEETTTANNQPSADDTELLAYTKNWPDSAVDRFKTTLAEKKTFKILFLGSKAIGSDTDGVFPIVKEKLEDKFGSDHVEVTYKTYKSSSTQFVNADKQEDIAKLGADLIIFEPFILTNNGLVLVEDTFKDIATIMDDIQAKKSETSFILQPSYPIYPAKIYPSQVEQLKQFAKKNDITYMDHWTAWPDSQDPALKEYLTTDQSAPSEKGVKVWSDYIVNFLLNEGESE
ncbi:hypothetical protein [Neobacillus mesonae]|uniref:SGNH/GDSL hydrolase family protein n=1 Tax=Neobacillus mesonae TaxID=1193713 RepID=UPI00203EB19E|nr:hypothetical protein [Neobacillus mesonae]MCM3569388.1 hypothetical protein [Neobacillus mesonae]